MLRAVSIQRAGEAQGGNVIDTLLLDYGQRRTPNGTHKGLRGTDIEIALRQSAPVATDDRLVLEDGCLIEVVARPEPLLEIRAADAARMARLAWHLGDRHIPAQLHERRIRVRREPATEKLLHALGVQALAIDAPFEPESGAYSGGHDHYHDQHREHHHPGGHDHGHHGHDHDH